MDLIRDTLPTELINLILSLTNIKSKRLLRSTNRYWFHYINIDEFQIFFARPNTIQDITIGLSFKKLVPKKTEEFPVHYLAQLTNLTSLQFNFYKSYETVTNMTALTTLTNLLHSNMDTTSNLTNLTTLMAYPRDLALLPLYKNLRRLKFKINDQQANPFALIANPSHLTYLNIQSRFAFQPDISENVMSQLANLTSLRIEYSQRGPLPRCFQHLTKLESLHVTNCLPQEDIFKLTRLTRLVLSFTVTTEDQFNYHKLSTLTNVRWLVMPEANTCEDYSFLMSMTKLQSFTIHGRNQASEGLKYMRSPHLTSLKVDRITLANINYVSHLTTLLELTLYEKVQQNYDTLSTLTNLTSLRFSTQDPASQLKVVSKLINLKSFELAYFTFGGIINLSLRNLTNLESLVLFKALSQETYNDLSGLRSLTSLGINLLGEVVQNNPSVLKSITSLKKLFILDLTPSQELWAWLTRLSDLEYLDVKYVDSEAVIESLSVLDKLTNLSVVDSHSLKGIHLTKLSNLQVISLHSKAAKEFYDAYDGHLSEKLTRLVDFQVT